VSAPHPMSGKLRGCGAAGVGTALFGALVLAAGCSPDLHETVGPLVPLPNVYGAIVRDGVPVHDIKVKLEDVKADTTYGDDRTDLDGRFTFSEVGPGTWGVRVDSEEAGDFPRVTFEFAFATPDTVLEVPDLDVSARALALEAPQAGGSLPVPDLFHPVSFQWSWDSEADAQFQIRLYLEAGSAFWFSQKVRQTRILWNGLANMPGFEGKAAEPGAYIWRLRVEGEGTLEYDTGYRGLSFQ